MTTPVRTSEQRFDHVALEAKWQARWERDGIYKVRDDDPRPKWFELTMYPYPSGDLHIGHWYAMGPADAHARFRRMQGYNVLHPMGFDAFGLPAENAAIRNNIHPQKWTVANMENMRRQLRSMGPVYDWERQIVTCEPEYYRWNQCSSSSSTRTGWRTGHLRPPTGVPPATRCWRTSRWWAMACASDVARQ